MAKSRKDTFVRELEQYVELHRDRSNGVAWVENGKVGLGHSAHPNISATGSLSGMRKRYGSWAKARVARSHGWIYNLDSLVMSDFYDHVAAVACNCEACRERKAKKPELLKVGERVFFGIEGIHAMGLGTIGAIQDCPDEGAEGVCYRIDDRKNELGPVTDHLNNGELWVNDYEVMRFRG